MKKIILFTLVLFSLLGCKKENSTDPSTELQGNTVGITSQPSGASIDIDSGNSGKITPYTFTNLSSGSHKFKVYKNDDYNLLDTTLYLQNNEQRKLSITFKPLWSFQWSGEVILNYGFYYPNYGVRSWTLPCGTMTVPTTLNSRIKITYEYNYDRENGQYKNYGYGNIYVGGKTYVAKTNIMIIDKTNGLVTGGSSKVIFNPPNLIDTPSILKSVVLETY